MTVYLDVVLIENLCMNYIILFATSYILKIKQKHIMMILSSLLGGIYAIATYMGVLKIYSNIFFKIILSIIMIYLAFTPNTIKLLIKELIFFYLILQFVLQFPHSTKLLECIPLYLLYRHSQNFFYPYCQYT